MAALIVWQAVVVAGKFVVNVFAPIPISLFQNDTRHSIIIFDVEFELSVREKCEGAA